MSNAIWSFIKQIRRIKVSNVCTLKIAINLNVGVICIVGEYGESCVENTLVDRMCMVKMVLEC